MLDAGILDIRYRIPGIFFRLSDYLVCLDRVVADAVSGVQGRLVAEVSEQREQQGRAVQGDVDRLCL